MQRGGGTWKLTPLNLATMILADAAATAACPVAVARQAIIKLVGGWEGERRSSSEPRGTKIERAAVSASGGQRRFLNRPNLGTASRRGWGDGVKEEEKKKKKRFL